MGTCCSSRTDVDGKTKDGKKSSSASKSSSGKTATGSTGAKKSEAIKFSAIDEVKNTIRQALRDSKFKSATLLS